MKTFQFLLLVFLSQFFVINIYAQTDSLQFMTSRDVLRGDVLSNINLRNNSSSPITLYGLYVRQFAYVTPGDTCDHSHVMYSAAQNITAGASVMPLTISAGKNSAMGSNYLYNLIYGANFYAAASPGCQLPGCTWGNDSTKYNWCIYLGALAPVANTSTYTSTVPPYTAVASGAGFNYNVINNPVYLGPISCDDRSLTCRVESQQTQLIF